MALVLVVNPAQKLQGVVTLFRGDRWTIDANIVSRIGNVDQVQDLTAYTGVTAFFPPATGSTPIAVACSVINALGGAIRAVVNEAVTPSVGLAQNPTSWYVEANTSAGLVTIETTDFPLVINDPAFNT